MHYRPKLSRGQEGVHDADSSSVDDAEIFSIKEEKLAINPEVLAAVHNYDEDVPPILSALGSLV